MKMSETSQEEVSQNQETIAEQRRSFAISTAVQIASMQDPPMDFEAIMDASVTIEAFLKGTPDTGN